MALFKTEGGTRRQHSSPQEIYLVIEVSDITVQYDSRKKLRAYENAGIQEYWIVDVPAKAMRVFRLDQRKKYQETRYSEGSIAVRAFPDVLVGLEDVF
jgi:Uma2 family endonuclease